MAVVDDTISWKIRPATKQDVPTIVWMTQVQFMTVTWDRIGQPCWPQAHHVLTLCMA